MDYELIDIADSSNSASSQSQAIETDSGPDSPGVNLCSNQNENPLLNDLILKNIFGFFGVEEMKLYRTVCQKWNFAARHHIIKRSKTKIIPELLANFLNEFRDRPWLIPCDTFSFKVSNPQKLWLISQLTTFFDTFGPFVKGLEFVSVQLKANDDTPMKIFDITPWINIALNLRKLTIRNTSEDIGSLVVSWNQLMEITHLDLRHCVVDMDNPAEITPVKLYLDNVYFKSCGAISKTYLVNQNINFNKLEEITIFYIPKEGEGPQPTYPMLDLGSDNIIVRNVSLLGAHIYNWDSCKWIVNSIFIKDIPISPKCTMKFKKISLGSTLEDLAVLRDLKTIEEIKFLDFDQGKEIICSQTMDLPNLTALYFDNSDNFSYLFNNFRNCHKLKKLCLNAHIGKFAVEENEILDLNILPTAVSIIKISKFSIVKVVNGPRQIDKLILWSFYCEEIDEILMKLKPKFLVVVYTGTQWDTQDCLVHLLTHLENVQNIAFGPIYWQQDKPFEENYLANYVDKKAKYYTFDASVGPDSGKALTKNQFFDLATV